MFLVQALPLIVEPQSSQDLSWQWEAPTMAVYAWQAFTAQET